MIFTSSAQAVECIKSNDNVFLHSAVAVPQELVQAMTNRHEELRNVSIYQIHTEGEAPYADPSLAESFTIKAFFAASEADFFSYQKPIKRYDETPTNSQKI